MIYDLNFGLDAKASLMIRWTKVEQQKLVIVLFKPKTWPTRMVADSALRRQVSNRSVTFLSTALKINSYVAADFSSN